MRHNIWGNTEGLRAAQLRELEKLKAKSIPARYIITPELGRRLCRLSEEIGRKIGLLIDRHGKTRSVFVGSKELLYIPDLGRFRLGEGRLRRLRLVYSSPGDSPPEISPDIYTDLEKLRLDLVCSLSIHKGMLSFLYAYNLPPTSSRGGTTIKTELVKNPGQFEFNFKEFIGELERQFAAYDASHIVRGKTPAVLVGVYPKSFGGFRESMEELKELAKTAGVQTLDCIVQRRNPDPKTVVGKGKLEELVLHCLRLGAEMIIFDRELKPAQWRAITNAVELKVLDRSMLILDIFAQRAHSSEGRIQVELAQLKYNLPKLVEEDAGLSRLTGGIGGRGPGETKLEVGRRRIRERIRLLEKRISKISTQRELRRKQRKGNFLPVVAILGYTNAGKSTLFNRLTSGSSFVEDKLFATLDPAHRRLRVPDKRDLTKNVYALLTDTVGFIRDLPDELYAAFKATLEELYEARLFLHVIDASDKEWRAKKESVDRILEEMGLKSVPTILLLNKCDKLSEKEIREIGESTEGIPISAKTGMGIQEAVKALSQTLL
ncbi:MAG: GTPase HflX [Candidatus Dadabacteria bacterium]|nr:MAG: GTPase HflX [Candidatus Dadabacteria bacterium]